MPLSFKRCCLVDVVCSPATLVCASTSPLTPELARQVCRRRAAAALTLRVRRAVLRDATHEVRAPRLASCLRVSACWQAARPHARPCADKAVSWAWFDRRRRTRPRRASSLRRGRRRSLGRRPCLALPRAGVEARVGQAPIARRAAFRYRCRSAHPHRSRFQVASPFLSRPDMLTLSFYSAVACVRSSFLASRPPGRAPLRRTQTSEGPGKPEFHVSWGSGLGCGAPCNQEHYCRSAVRALPKLGQRIPQPAFQETWRGAKLGCITPYSERPSPKFYATDEGRLTSLNPMAALRRCR